MSERMWTAEEIAAAREHLRRRQEEAYRAREERRAAALHAVRAAVAAVLPRFPAVRRAYLFGSVTRPGAMRPDSDVDVAIEGDLSAEEYFALWRELEEASGEVIDLRELNKDLPLTWRIQEVGELVYERSLPDAESGN